jgi:3-carboxy-cis,cis-muconate cycloisomerase
LSTFGALFVPAPLREAVSDAAWLTAMLDVERALVRAAAAAGFAPADAAAAVAAQCDPALYDIEQLCEDGRAAGNPAEPLVRALRERVGGDAATWAHVGATSQDVMDSAAMLVARNALGIIDDELEGVAAECARLADEHRATAMAARTLLQQAVPTTFGLKAAGWLVDVLDARLRLGRLTLPVQLGGAAGTLAVFGDRGVEIARLLADELDLAEPALPWHVHRGRIAELAGALGAVASASAKIGLDVVLLAQTEVGEVAEAEGGVSSTLPQKRNPIRAVLARACARGVHAQVPILTGGDYELERAAGAWHAEWNALSEALALAGGSAAAARGCLDGLVVHADRMRANMHDGLFAERDAFVERGVLEAGADADYLGSAGVFVDRALARCRGTT